MRASWSLLLACSFASLAPATFVAAGADDLLPVPERRTPSTGALVVGPRFTAAAVGAVDPRVDAALLRAVQRLAAQTGLPLPKPARGRPSATLLVDVAGPGLAVQSPDEDESYTLAVTPQQARLHAPNPLGALRGLETFLQLVGREAGRYAVPALEIRDSPRFRWRGLLIDPCRHWQPVDVVLRNLDAMAAVKLNVLHWHLSEDQGWRIESRLLPRLHELGSDGLYYTQQQARDVVAYARERGIRVVPEFDMPGHATSLLVGYPELGSGKGPYALVRSWGIFDGLLDPTREDVYAFVDRFVAEMAGLFPDAYFHVGGDEVRPREWNANPAIQDFMYRQELADAAELQAHFNARVNQVLARHGKRMVGWDEVLRPELPKNIVVQSWRGAASLKRAASMGYDGILSNGYYLDHMQPASFHYRNDPLPDAADPDARRHVLGGEACMWSEFVSPETIDSRIWPRAAAIAERLWSPAEVRDVPDMYRRLEVQSARLTTLGLKHQSNYLPMLQRLLGGAPADALRVLADVVEPVKLYARGSSRVYTTATPLDRLVDAARPESDAARAFKTDVEQLLGSNAPRDDERLRTALARWRDNHSVLEPLLATATAAADARPLSRDLSRLAGVGLSALDAIALGAPPPTPSREDAQRLLERAQKPHAELVLAVAPSIRKLAFAAEKIESLKALPPQQWNAWLDERLAQPPAGGER